MRKKNLFLSDYCNIMPPYNIRIGSEYCTEYIMGCGNIFLFPYIFCIFFTRILIKTTLFLMHYKNLHKKEVENIIAVHYMHKCIFND